MVRRTAQRILRLAPALLVAALWLSLPAVAQTANNARAEALAAPKNAPCYSCQVPTCPSGSPTTITGKVYTPNGVDPLPNALVFIPQAAPPAFQAGVQCLTEGTQAGVNAYADGTSATDGSFTLTNVPAGANIPIVIQSGKWRFQATIPNVVACQNNVAPADATSMPKIEGATTTNGADNAGVGVGDIPQMALVTGSVDAMECVLRQTGIADSEFSDPTGKGRIHIFKGDTSSGATLDSSTPAESTLVGSPAALATYDILLFDCQGSPDTDANSTTQANLINWANAGGRLFGTHFNYAWLYNDSFSTVADWNVNQNQLADGPATINTTFTGGAQLAQWLVDVGASTVYGHIAVNTTRHDQTGVVAPTQYWSTLDNGVSNDAHPVMQLTFNTPVGADASKQCGRVLFNEYHVNNVSDSGMTFPKECGSTTPSAMTPQEKMLEYALFDLATAITPVTTSTASQSYLNTPVAFTQGDTGDQIAVDVTNTSGNSTALTSSLVLTATLPTGVTATSAADPTGGWSSCVVSGGGTTVTCTRTTPLAAGASDAIDIAVNVAPNAPTGTNVESLTSTVTGGGLPIIVNGADPLTILGGHSISWQPNPLASIPYGTPLSSTQLDAVALYGGATVSGSYAYTTGGTTITAGTILPAGTYPLSVTFTPTAGSGLPAQTTTDSIVVTQIAGAINWPTPAAITYGTPLSGTQLDASATCNGQTIGGSYAYTPASGVLSAGNQTLSVTFTPTAASSCTFAPTTVVLPVNKALLTVTADSKTMNFGAAVPPLTYTINPNGLVNGDPLSVVSGVAALSTTVTPATVPGSYPGSIAVTQGSLAAANYNFAFVPGNFTVNSVAGVISWPTPAAITYGTPLSGTQLDASATCNGITVAGSYAYTPASGVLGAGNQTLSVTFTPTAATSCTFAPTSVVLPVNKALLTITATNESKVYNTANPVLGYTTSGFVNGDNVGSLTGTLALSTTAALNSPAKAGGYPITFVQPTPTDPNYTISYVPGTLTILQGTGAITWATPAAINYGTLLSATQLDAAATCNGIAVAGSYSYTPAASTLLAAGTDTLKVTFTPTDSASCPVESTTVQLVVNKLPTVTKVVPATSKPNPGQKDTLTATVTGGLNETGTVVFTAGGSTICTSTVAANGTATCVYTPTAKSFVTVTAAYSGDNNNLSSAGSTKLDVCGCNNPTAKVTLTAAQTQLSYPGYTILTACVAISNNAYPQGTVSFYDGTTLLGTVYIPQGNDCVSLNIPHPGLNVGQHPIVAVFTPVTSTGATSNTVVLTVTAKATTMEASCWNNSFPYGGGFQCDTNMDSGSKSGFMLYSLDGGVPVTLPLNSDGHAWFTIAKPSVGNHVVKLWYPTQGNYLGCNVPDQQFTVTPAPVQVQLVPNTFSAKVGTDFKFTATVSSWSAGAPNKDGSVTFYDNGVVVGKRTVDAYGVAKFDAGCLPVGIHNITATYGGSKNYGTGSASLQVSSNR